MPYFAACFMIEAFTSRHRQYFLAGRDGEHLLRRGPRKLHSQGSVTSRSSRTNSFSNRSSKTSPGSELAVSELCRVSSTAGCAQDEDDDGQPWSGQLAAALMAAVVAHRPGDGFLSPSSARARSRGNIFSPQYSLRMDVRRESNPISSSNEREHAIGSLT